jgi:hypothetical protein
MLPGRGSVVGRLSGSPIPGATPVNDRPQSVNTNPAIAGISALNSGDDKKSDARGQSARWHAEPVSSLYEQGRVHHVGVFAELETQMCSFVPDHLDGSPDRVDALVWALTELLVHREPEPNIRFPDDGNQWTGRPTSAY